MSAEASPQAAAPGENTASKKESQRKKRWETLVEIMEVLVLAIVADASIFTAYLRAHSAGDTKLATQYVRRFTPDYKVAFLAWLRTDPFTSPAAPAGPADMPQYRNPQLEAAARLNADASATFEQGSIARDNAEAYLRDTVLFATVLFVVAIAQRFKVRAVRVTTTAIALALAAYTVVEMLTLPRV